MIRLDKLIPKIGKSKSDDENVALVQEVDELRETMKEQVDSGQITMAQLHRFALQKLSAE